jgi:hypothetical protein
MGQDDPRKNGSFEPVKLRLDRSERTLASVVAKARPGIRFNKYIESDCPTVFADIGTSREGVVSETRSVYC